MTFCRAYRTVNYKPRLIAEIAVTLVMAVGTVLLLTTSTGRNLPSFMLYGALIIGFYFLVKLLRILSNLLKVKDDDVSRSKREFAFDETGFVFGPVGPDGKLIHTIWTDIDKVLITDGVIYISAMQRRHFASVDENKLVKGNWVDLIELIEGHMEKRRVKHFK